ncbi:uncharacterized protein Ecym_4536 [Eremothecium cymbalariae DBVPG|uniref:Uncharacterized protein n=1 Tax=Eremothecium cymbalariae (strain CBS 270.75 / DBVPG 7215 / KCTC 17166 / NRRL Y-17582) TaxID=931890 RepID=G8JU69_ERECY|nr:hypothetical protein Ecym_4536 [Eremothecium cymbalariae DBVPG\
MSLEAQHLGLSSLNPLLLRFWCLYAILKLPLWKYLWFPFGNFISLGFWIVLCSEICKQFQATLEQHDLWKVQNYRAHSHTAGSRWGYGITEFFRNIKDRKEKDLFLFGKCTQTVLELSSNWEFPCVIDSIFSSLLLWVDAFTNDETHGILSTFRSYFPEKGPAEDYDMLDDVLRDAKTTKG